jgi:hypothetical protein
MATSSSLMKTSLHNSIADGLYTEIITNYSRYYYFLGRTLTWEDELTPPQPVDSFAYDLQTRNEIITMKAIKATDVAYVVARHNWISGTVYDHFDDQYSTEVQGVNLTDGGFSYGSAPYVYIGSQGSVSWSASAAVTYGTMLKTASGKVYVVTNTGITGTTAPTFSDEDLDGTATLLYINHNDANGSGATAEATVLDGSVIDITMTHRGIGYTGNPTVTIIGGGGGGAQASGVVTKAASGTQKVEDAIFYVVTDEYNVYQCVDNNNGGISTRKPTGTSVDAIGTSDGYIWKFLYNIPIALRNKFLTDSYMPVVTALRDQFYSSGTLKTIRLNQAGSGYTFGTITVQGDGFASAEGVYLTGHVVDNVGSGYTSPTVSIDPPVNGVSSWLNDQAVILGQHLAYNNNIYEIVISGTTGVVGPVHRFGVVENGSAALKYVGTTATAEAVVVDGEVTDLILYGMLKDIQVVGGGSGYTSAPTVNFSGGSGSAASATAILQNGSVIKIQIDDPGYDYLTAPDITLGIEWEATTSVSIGDQIFYSNRLYTVTGAGTTSGTPPAHLSGSAANGSATLDYAGEQSTALASIKYGSGYSEYPAISITEELGEDANSYFVGSKTEAKLIPIFASDTSGQEWNDSTSYSLGLKVWYSNRLYTVTTAGISGVIEPTHTSGSTSNGTCIFRFEGYFGQLVGVQIDDPGIGYTFANLNVTGDGDGAEIVADLSPGDVNTLQANIELLTVDGKIVNCPVISGGYGYGSATVTITGDGSGATAEAVISDGAIISINMISTGAGYRKATVTITGTGFGAQARAIIGPYGGYGKEALNNLYARTLMFYSNISQDRNQGFNVNNDYRQIGIIKSPRQFSNTQPLTLILASACWVISGVANPTLFPADSTIYKTSDSTRFRIVTNTGTSLLLQSIDNSLITSGDTFTNDNSDLFSSTAVTPPNVDKYSGDLLFIDNKQAFTPTTDEAVTLRTVIRF